MSVICGVVTKQQVAISCDSQSSYGSLAVSARHINNSSKLYEVNNCYIGIVGWSAIANIIEHLIGTNKTLFKLNTRMEIFSTLLSLHDEMKEKYFLETHEEDDQPVESNQLDLIIINNNGLFSTASYREVNRHNTYWAIGSGQKLALGAMHAVYSMELSAREIAEAGVMAASEFDDGCCLPFETNVIDFA